MAKEEFLFLDPYTTQEAHLRYSSLLLSSGKEKIHHVFPFIGVNVAF